MRVEKKKNPAKRLPEKVNGIKRKVTCFRLSAWQKQWRQQLGEQMVVDRLERYQYNVALRHVGRLVIGVDGVEMERALAGVYLQTMSHDIVVVAVQQEVYLLAAMGEFATIVSADGAGANDTVDEFLMIHI